MSKGRTYTLRNAASIVFALTAVIPLLLFTYTLYLLNQLGQTQAQLGLGVALGCALVGLFIFSNLMGRLSEVLRFIEEQPVAPGAPAEAGSDADRASRPVTAATNGPAAAPWSGPGGLVVPGLGTITAASRAASAARHAAGVFDEVQKTMWQAEAQRHLGRRVLISVKNAPEPIAGSLAQIAEDGVLLEQDDHRVAVSYLRITNIDLDPADV
ncbi:MAG TPA: hypothetical protein VK878_05390 [Candidatus Deferrimicrobiaceae bacterium]|jgi:hypothetical protein|nr:hypothetical protein [Candidatus Deferrimicrobiaceae bacterium]